jgi:hypothetical protein
MVSEDWSTSLLLACVMHSCDSRCLGHACLIAHSSHLIASFLHHKKLRLDHSVRGSSVAVSACQLS